MARFHVHVAVADLDASIHFYTALFGQEPRVREGDYAKWHLTEPPLNFAISTGEAPVGISHLGVEAENADEFTRLQQTSKYVPSSSRGDVHNTNCCYANSNKYWIKDPQGIAWEYFHTQGPRQDEGKSETSCTAPPSHQPTRSCC